MPAAICSASSAAIDGRADEVDERLARVQARRHAPQLVLHEPEAADRLSELLAFRGVLRGELDEPLLPADRAGAQPGAAVVQDRHGDLEPLPLLAEQVLPR